MFLWNYTDKQFLVNGISIDAVFVNQVSGNAEISDL